MYSEIMKLIPTLDMASLKKMQQTLQTRFTKIAKGFGNGLKNIFKGGGWLGLALSAIDKILNPLKETTEAIERTLKNSADIVTNAQQFGTTAGRLYKLQQLASSKGIDQDALYTLISKFQASVAEANADPTAPSAVRQFARETDMAAGFFEFIQAVQRMDKNQQILVQQSVFGEKQILKMASFLQTDFGARVKELGLGDGDRYTPGLQKLDRLDDLSQVLAVRTQIADDQAKAGIINESMVRARDRAAAEELKRQNMQIRNFESLNAISQTTTKIMTLVDQGVGLLGDFIKTVTPFMNRIANSLEAFGKSPAMRGIFKYLGKGE